MTTLLTIDPVSFWSRVDQSDATGCWPWLGAVNDSGYGIVRVGGATRRAHRVAHTLAIGPIPDGFQVDHVSARGCRRRDCCNPAHLEAVTPKVNSERSTAGAVNRARMLARTSCVRGHEFTPQNTHVGPQGVRVCRACKRETARRLYVPRGAVA